MIQTISDFEEFKKVVKEKQPDVNFDSFLQIDLPYFEQHDDFTIISIPTYESQNDRDILFLSEENTFIYSKEKISNYEKKFEKFLKQKFGESTIMTFHYLRKTLRMYFKEFERIREKLNKLDLDPSSEEIENSGRSLRLLTDRIEGFVQIIMNLKESELKEFNVELIQFDYDLLMAKSRYELERCRSHMYRIASLRTKAEMKSSSDLNATMKRLTVIMTFLTIVSIVISVPGTIGAIFGIPALSNAYFNGHTELLVFALVFLTLLSIFLGFIYWKSLKMK